MLKSIHNISPVLDSDDGPLFETDIAPPIKEFILSLDDKGRSASSKYECIYELVRLSCFRHDHAQLYSLLISEIQFLVGKNLDDLQEKIKSNQIFQPLENAWESFCLKMKTVYQVFLYFNQVILPSLAPSSSITFTPTVWTIAVDAYKSHLISNCFVLNSIIDSFLQLLHQFRIFRNIDHDTLPKMSLILSVFSTLNLSVSHLYPKLLSTSSSYYSDIAYTNISTLKIDEYLKFTDLFISFERKLLSSLLDPLVEKELLDCCYNIFITEKKNVILDTGLKAMISNMDFIALSLTYRFINEIKNQSSLVFNFGALIKARFDEIISSLGKSSPISVIPTLIKFIQYIDKIARECFGNDELILNAVKESLSSAISSSKKFISFLLVRYLSDIIDSSCIQYPSSDSNEASPTAKIDSAFFIFRLIQGKYDFELFYKNQLAKRLLLGFMFSDCDNQPIPPLNIPLEKYVILKLKGECGISFTYKLEGMLKDISTSLAYHKKSPSLGLTNGFSTTASLSILTPNFWPTTCDSKINQRILRHPFFEKDLGSFSATYRSFNPGQHLTFSLKTSTCIVDVILPNSKGYSLFCSVHQAIVLEGISNCLEPQSFSRLEKISGLTKNDLADVLESLLQAELLTKSTETFFIEDSLFIINPNFNSERNAVVNILSGLYSNALVTNDLQETLGTMNGLQPFSSENVYQLDAAIVRILKKNGTLTRSVLLSQVANAIKFQVEVKEITSRIDALVLREFISTDSLSTEIKYSLIP